MLPVLIFLWVNLMKYTADKPGPLLDLLQTMAPESSKNTLRSWLQSGRVTLDGRRAERANIRVSPGQEIAIGTRVTFLKGSLRILHEDDQIVVLEKPAGLLSVATEKESRATVHAMLKRRFHHRRVYPVHRLDRDTSGVMLFVYDEQTQKHLKDQFEQQSIDKTYFAIVEKTMPIGRGTWESWLEEDDFLYVRTTNDSVQGKRALTFYEVLKAEKGCSLLRLQPKTGRKNQLRVHCSEAGHPMVGDKKYGAATNPLKRVCLHAQKITFTHPATGRRMTFSSPLPESFSKIMDIQVTLDRLPPRGS
jgi:tRNA pseudouridine32 synthase/23S rRNA pseudouridine746 synthase/23S rRNA pseudouridine1911/1915/1917 synthase